MKRILAGIGLILLLMTALFYAGDYLILRFRVATNRSAFGMVTVRTYYAVHEKNDRTEYVFKDQEDETCVHSLFSHMGYSPCWYLRRHPEQQIVI